MNLLICDDSGKQVVLMERALFNYQIQKNEKLFQVYTALSTNKASEYINSVTLDIAILDIEIDEKTGIDLAKRIKEHNQECKIIFMTNYDSFAYAAYELEAFSYLLKPLEQKKLFYQLDKILLIKQKENAMNKLVLSEFKIQYKGKTTYINLADILYIEKSGKNVIVVTDQSRYEYIGNLKDIEQKLDKEGFLRCHNGFIVNVNRINAYRKSELYVGKQEVPIPVSKVNRLKVAQVLEKKLWESFI